MLFSKISVAAVLALSAGLTLAQNQTDPNQQQVDQGNNNGGNNGGNDAGNNAGNDAGNNAGNDGDNDGGNNEGDNGENNGGAGLTLLQDNVQDASSKTGQEPGTEGIKPGQAESAV